MDGDGGHGHMEAMLVLMTTMTIHQVLRSCEMNCSPFTDFHVDFHLIRPRGSRQMYPALVPGIKTALF